MKFPILITISIATTGFATLSAQGIPLTPPSTSTAAPTPINKPTTEIVTDTQQEQQLPGEAELSDAEKQIRAGIVLLGMLHDTMAKVQNKETAEAAVAPVMRLRDALTQWINQFAVIPQCSEMEKLMYEERYLPIIKQLNNAISNQADRLAAAAYYDCTELCTALVMLTEINH